MGRFIKISVVFLSSFLEFLHCKTSICLCFSRLVFYYTGLVNNNTFFTPTLYRTTGSPTFTAVVFGCPQHLYIVSGDCCRVCYPKLSEFPPKISKFPAKKTS